MSYPSVIFDLGGSKLSEKKFQVCLLLVQSYVLSPENVHKCFFTDSTLDAVQEAIADAGVIYVGPNFDLWTEFCGGIAEAFVSRYRSWYNSFLSERWQSFEAHYLDVNKSNRLARSQQDVSASATVSSNVSAPVKWKGSNQRAGAIGKSRPNKDSSTGSNLQKKDQKGA